MLKVRRLIFSGRTDTCNLLPEIEALRLEVWTPKTGALAAQHRFGIDEADLDAHHYVIEGDHGQLLASARLVLTTNAYSVPDLQAFGPFVDQMRFPLAVLNRLVVHPCHQGRGFSALIDNCRVSDAASLGACAIWVEAEQSRAGHLARRFHFEDRGASPDNSIPGNWRILCKPLDAANKKGPEGPFSSQDSRISERTDDGVYPHGDGLR
jgi:GNAT superfamily N-acetyltransferase